MADIEPTAATTHNALSLTDIAILLGETPKPRQAGPLKYHTKSGYICSICGVGCQIEVNGRIYCTTHAIYALNATAMGNAIPNDCTCDVGKRTMFSLHTHDCAVYSRLHE